MRAPVLAVGDGGPGFWGALREVFPEAREQRCWFHKIANVLAALPRSAHPGATKALAEIWNAEDRENKITKNRGTGMAPIASRVRLTLPVPDRGVGYSAHVRIRISPLISCAS